MPGGLVVEFVGLPGAGKSTVAPRLARALTSRGFFCGNREMINEPESHFVMRYGRLARFFLRCPSELRSAIRLGSAEASLTPLRLVQGLKYLSAWSYRLALARRHGYEVLVLDQGVVQDAWSLMLRGVWRVEMVQAAASRTILAANLPYILVYFDVAVDVAAKRIAQRPTMYSRFDHLDPVDTARQLALQGERLAELFTRVVEMTGAAYHRVDASQAPEDTCTEIVAFVEAALRDAPEPRVIHR